MRREAAIADDYWQDIFKQNKHDQMKATLQNIEQKWEWLFILFSEFLSYELIYIESTILHHICKTMTSLLR